MARLDPKERRSIQVDFVYDIETENWDQFVVGGLYDPMKGFRIFWWDHKRGFDDYCEAIVTRQDEYGWAHAGGGYDSVALLDYAAKLGLRIKLMATGQRIIMAEVEEGPKLCDSFALIPLPLKLASEIGGAKKIETGLDCICGKGCGGFCAIKRFGMSGTERKRLAEYLEIDCLGLYKTLRKLDEFTREHDLDLGLTIGSSAWRSAQRLYDLPKADWDMGELSPYWHYSRAREGYFGGRTQVFKPESSAGYRYDINSAYPAALTQIAVPTGAKQLLYNGRAARAFANGKPGIYSAEVYVPDCFMPPLPLRTAERITYPTGVFNGTWTALELQYAESVGCEILDVTRGFVWSEEAPLLRDWCNKVWALRAVAGPKTGLGMWLKWYANSLTGKLAQFPVRESAIFNPDPTDPAWQPCSGCGERASSGICMQKCSRVRPIDRVGKRMWVKDVIQMPTCGHVQWAAYLTASTRVTLHRQGVDDEVGGASMVYCDTDSIISERPRTFHVEGDDVKNPTLGWWKFEGTYIHFRALAPKTYRFEDPISGKKKARSKGVPDAEKVFHLLESGETVVIDRGVLSWKSGARKSDVSGRIFQRKMMTRGCNADGIHFGDRVLGADGLTYPPRRE